MTPTRPGAWLLPAVAVSCLLVAWEVAVRVSGTATTPAPTAVLASLVEAPGFYLENAAATLLEALAGLLLAIAIGVSTASLFALWLPVRHALFPLVVLSQTIPLVAVAPLLASVIGDGLFSRVLVTSWLCWFPVVVSATHGLIAVDPRRLALFETYSASRADVFWKLRVPSSAGSLLAGIRAAAGFALIGAIVVEYSGAPKGLGAFLMAQVIHPTDTTRVFGVVLVAALSGLALTELTHVVARRLLRAYLPDGT